MSGPKGEIPGSPSRQIASRPPLPPSRHRLRPAELARLFHDTYERLAPAFGYSTRPESKVAWNDVPENSRLLMIATAAEVLQLIDGSQVSENLTDESRTDG